MPRRRRRATAAHSPQIAGRYVGKKNQKGGGGTGPDGSEIKRDGAIAAVKALYQEDFNDGGRSKKEEKAVNKMAEKLMKLSKEIESMKEWAPENFEAEEVHASGIKAFKAKIDKANDKKRAVWGERESVKGGHEEEKTAESKASKADRKSKKKRDGESKEKKSETWGGWASDTGSERDEMKGKSNKPKAGKKVKFNGAESHLFEDSLLDEDYAVKMKKGKKGKKDGEGRKRVKNSDIESPRFEGVLIPPDGVEKDKKDKKDKTNKKDKHDKENKKSKKDKDKKDKDVRPKEGEGEEKKVKGYKRSVPVPTGVYGVV